MKHMIAFWYAKNARALVFGVRWKKLNCEEYFYVRFFWPKNIYIHFVHKFRSGTENNTGDERAWKLRM